MEDGHGALLPQDRHLHGGMRLLLSGRLLFGATREMRGTGHSLCSRLPCLAPWLCPCRPRDRRRKVGREGQREEGGGRWGIGTGISAPGRPRRRWGGEWELAQARHLGHEGQRGKKEGLRVAAPSRAAIGAGNQELCHGKGTPAVQEAWAR